MSSSKHNSFIFIFFFCAATSFSLKSVRNSTEINTTRVCNTPWKRCFHTRPSWTFGKPIRFLNKPAKEVSKSFHSVFTWICIQRRPNLQQSNHLFSPPGLNQIKKRYVTVFILKIQRSQGSVYKLYWHKIPTQSASYIARPLKQNSPPNQSSNDPYTGNVFFFFRINSHPTALFLPRPSCLQRLFQRRQHPTPKQCKANML